MATFLAIGHVALDEFPDGARRLGGTALYAAATAARLGVRSALLTRAGPTEEAELGRVCADLGIDLRVLAANVTTTFAFRWEPDGRRVLRLRARAKGISLGDVPADLRSAEAVVLGSVARELSRDLLAGVTARAAVLAAQGFLRIWDADGTVRPAEWRDAEREIGGMSAVVLSEDDVAGDADLAARWSRVTPVVLTLAERGARVYQAGRAAATLAAYPPARVVDTTGAGDTFAAGLAIALLEGLPLADACRFANAVASFSIEGAGTGALAGRAAVERRLRV